MSGKKPNQWMPFHIDSFYAKTRHLSRLERHAYLDLLLNYWRTQEPLPDDDKKLARLADMTDEEWSESREIIREFFTVKKGRLHQRRIDEEIEKAVGISRKRQESGKKGGRPKKDEKQLVSKCLANDNQLITNSKPNENTRACIGQQSVGSMFNPVLIPNDDKEIDELIKGFEVEWNKDPVIQKVRARARKAALKNTVRGVA